MKKLLPLRVAINGILVIISSIIVFHLLVMTGLLPFEVVWGGTASGTDQVRTMELISIVVNIAMLTVVCAYAGIIKTRMKQRFFKGSFWIMFALFLLNTVGNLMAETALETYLFTPLTVLLTLFCFRIAAFEFKNKQSL